MRGKGRRRENEKKRARLWIAVVGLAAVVFCAAFFTGRLLQFRRAYLHSDAYRFRELMKTADADYAGGGYRNAFDGYSAALELQPDSQEAQNGQYLALLGLARSGASLGVGSSDLPYRMLLNRYPEKEELFLETAQMYLEREEYPQAAGILRRGSREAGHAALEEIYQTFLKSLHLTTMQEYRDGRLVASHIYDAAGNETETIWYNNEEKIDSRRESFYDSAGKLTGEKEYGAFASGRLPESCTEWEYDERGNLLQERIYDRDGRLWTRCSYLYDADGREISVESVTYDSEDETRGRVEFAWENEYDEAGNLIRYTQWEGDKDTEPVRVDTTVYDSRKRPVEEISDSQIEWRRSVSVYEDREDGGSVHTETVYNREGEITDVIETVYDAAGRETEEYAHFVTMDEDSYYAWLYDEAGNLIWEQSPYTESWYVFDESGQMIRHTQYYTDGWKLEYTYTYDEMGNLIREYQTSPDEDDEWDSGSVTEYRYTYQYSGDRDLLKQ